MENECEIGWESGSFKFKLNELAHLRILHFYSLTLEKCQVDMPNVAKSEKVLKKLMRNPL